MRLPSSSPYRIFRTIRLQPGRAPVGAPVAFAEGCRTGIRPKRPFDPGKPRRRGRCGAGVLASALRLLRARLRPGGAGDAAVFARRSARPAPKAGGRGLWQKVTPSWRAGPPTPGLTPPVPENAARLLGCPALCGGGCSGRRALFFKDTTGLKCDACAPPGPGRPRARVAARRAARALCRLPGPRCAAAGGGPAGLAFAASLREKTGPRAPFSVFLPGKETGPRAEEAHILQILEASV